MNLSKILIPVDFSPSSLAAVETAIGLARSQASRITFLQVIDAIYYDVGWLQGGMVIPRESIDKSKEGIGRRLEDLAASAKESGLEVMTRIEEGTPFQTILDTADDVLPDLIVMGTHGRRGLSHLFLGSVAEKVVRMAKCPVLTVKAEGDNDGDQRDPGRSGA